MAIIWHSIQSHFADCILSTRDVRVLFCFIKTSMDVGLSVSKSISQSVTQQYEDIHYGSKIEFIGNEELPHKRKLIYCSGIQTKIGLSFSTKEMWSEFVCKMYRYWQKVLQKCQSIHLHLCRTSALFLPLPPPQPNWRRRNEHDNLEWEGAWHTFHFKTIMIWMESLLEKGSVELVVCLKYHNICGVLLGRSVCRQ